MSTSYDVASVNISIAHDVDDVNTVD